MNKKEGKGIGYFSDGRYDGDWIKSKREGKGTYFWSDGKKYVGDWKDNKKEGKGVLYAADGSKLKEGDWKNDEFVG